jgi:Alpha-L-arabinofuranosidase B, catalytic/NPCBM-associated, NEW3 domain of alpha-galactosidase
MKTKTNLVTLLALALMVPVATLMIAAQSGVGRNRPRPQGPCDVYAAGGAPCVAAHSSTRALYAAYNGPLYQVMRQSDGKTLNIGVVQPSATDAGGYADAAAQDSFCANTYCWITTLYDQSGRSNNLVQAPRGGFSGPAMGGFNNLPVADWAPVTIMGHKVYGVFIAPGMGLRWNDAHGTAVDDQSEGQYWVVNGHHYNGGCCYDYGNAETDSRDDGNGTMETTYFGNATPWYHGPPPGPWIMTDQENNLVGCVNPDGSKNCPDLPSITWRFVTAMADGEPHHWRSMGGDAQTGELKIMFDGPRVNRTYDPMRKQGGILLGNGGDNSNGSQGTFYEGAMTAAGTFPSQETNQKIQANVVAAKYDEPPVGIAPASATAKPSGLQTFSPRSSKDITVTFRNTTGTPVTDVRLSISAPKGWTAVANNSATMPGPIAPGATVSETFKVTSASATFNGDLMGRASWKNASGVTLSEIATEKVRNVNPVKINEFAASASPPTNSTDSFIELYNTSETEIDISYWTLTQHPSLQPIFSSVKIPARTRIPARGFYVLGLASSGLAVPSKKGDTIIHVRSTTGMSTGDTIEIDTDSGVETRKIVSIGTPAGNPTMLWQPLPDGPVITISVGSTNVPVTGLAGFEVGQKIGIGYGATYPTVAKAVEKYEVVTVTAVGKQGTQAWLTAPAKAGETNIKVSSVANISVGDKIRLDIDSVGHGIETVTVAHVGTASVRNAFNGPLSETNLGTGLDLAEPLKFNHSYNISFSARGTGIDFHPKTSFAHSSNEPIQPLGTGITLDKPLADDHPINAVVRDATVTSAGYQGTPNQWYGGPAFANAGNIVLRDDDGLVVDSLNYGGVVDPWASEGYQGTSPGNGCSVSSPRGGGGARGGNPTATARSAGRFPDGADTDSNCDDFHLQPAAVLMTDSGAGVNNIKVSTVDFNSGQTIIIGVGANRETAVIATVGTPGGTTVRTAVDAGATAIPVVGILGFSVGQSITIDNGTNQETAVVASVTGARGRGPGASINVSAPLTIAHAADAQVSGSGITFTAGLTKAHESGAQVIGDVPTPGSANRYFRRAR